MAILPHSLRAGGWAEASITGALSVGRGISKAMQASDWGSRPLSLPQLLYAAHDAQVTNPSPALSQRLILAKKFGAPGLFCVPKLTGLCLGTSIST